MPASARPILARYSWSFSLIHILQPLAGLVHPQRGPRIAGGDADDADGDHGLALWCEPARRRTDKELTADDQHGQHREYLPRQPQRLVARAPRKNGIELLLISCLGRGL